LRKTSLVDFPGCVAAVFFFTGCNLRCPWCHNRELVTGEGADVIGLDEALSFIEKRRQVLGGVVLSGGEPAIYPGLPELVQKLRGLKLKIKLDTNGMNPGMLEKLFAHEETRPDYIALDLKIAPRRYGELLGAGAGHESRSTPGENLKQSAELIRGSGIAHEYRTIALPGGFISTGDIEELAPLAGGAPWYFRPFRPGNCLDPAWDGYTAPGSDAVQALVDTARKLEKNALCP
jgi:pyruvate formate lyase activating enzyme